MGRNIFIIIFGSPVASTAPGIECTPYKCVWTDWMMQWFLESIRKVRIKWNNHSLYQHSPSISYIIKIAVYILIHLNDNFRLKTQFSRISASKCLLHCIFLLSWFGWKEFSEVFEIKNFGISLTEVQILLSPFPTCGSLNCLKFHLVLKVKIIMACF